MTVIFLDQEDLCDFTFSSRQANDKENTALKAATAMPTMDVELFAGAGGLTLGLSQAGFLPDHLFESNKYCCSTLRTNSTTHPRHIVGEVHQSDVTNVDWSKLEGRVRLLSAGPPCQPFSFAGKHLADQDSRNQFPATLRAIRALKPNAILLENVPGLLRTSFRPYLDYIARQLEIPSLEPHANETWDEHDRRILQHQTSRGYRPEYFVRQLVLNAADYGVPQVRVRVFFIAVATSFQMPKPPPPTHSRAALMASQRSGAYWSERDIRSRRRDSWPRRVHASIATNDDSLLPWCTVRDALSGLSKPAREVETEDLHWVIPGARLYERHSGSEMDWPAKTIKAGVHGVAGGENVLILDNHTFRYFTLREMARVQGFPDTFKFSGPRSRIIGQIGNAVPCRLAFAVGRQIASALSIATQAPAPRLVVSKYDYFANPQEAVAV